MSESPKSEEFPSRFSTPVNELDDHRFQPESLPRADTNTSTQGRPRRVPRRSLVGASPGMLSVRDAYYQADNVRDFENAIEDEEDTSRGNTRRPSITLQLPSPSLAINARDEPTSALARSNTFRRARVQNDRGDRSSASVTSDRSVSPPNSVDAFAGPRPARARAGTAASIAPSCITLPRSIQMQHHSSIFRERRPTFTEDRPIRVETNEASSQGSVEDDVCFPQPDEQSFKLFGIDFDELDDFVAEYRHRTTHVPIPFGNKQGVTGADQRTRVFHALCSGQKHDAQTLNAIASEESRSPSDQPTPDGESSIGEEKRKLDCFDSNDLPGSVPINRWSFFSSELEDTIHAPELGDLLKPGETFQNLFELGPDGGVWWLDMLMPSEEEVEAVCKAFGVHGLTREDIVEQETREKVELFKSYYFVCFRSFFQLDKTSDFYLEPVNVYAVVFREGILTFTFCPSPHAANVRKRMSRLRDYVSLGADWICYALIDDIVDSYQPVIREIENESETIEDNVFTARMEDSRAVLRQIGECRKTVMSLSRLLGGKADVIKGFAKRCNEQYTMAPRQDVGLYLSDIQDHVVTMMSNLGHFEKMLSRSHSNYLAQISLDNIAQGNRANAVLSKVTFIATILVPLNLVCGIFGMNVEVPGKYTSGLGWFFGILGFLALFVAVVSIAAKRMKLI